MTLGNRIAALRSKHHMSQGDLAERLNVSRQSVSKWETDTSVPDLDKLIALSEIFAITLDELVKGHATEETTSQDQSNNHISQERSQYTAHNSSISPCTTLVPAINDTQRIVGFILLAVGLFGTVLSLVLTSNLLLLSILLILFGILCLTIKRHVGLIIGWIILIPAFFILPWMTGITPLGILYMLRHLGDAKINLSMIIAALYWISVLTMFFITWRTFHKKKHS